MVEYFPQVKKPVRFEGPDSKNPLAFKWYDARRVVGVKTMAAHLKFAASFWHTFVSTGADQFGAPVYDRPWQRGSNEMETAENTLDAAFEFFSKVGVPYFCFHDRDIAPEGGSVSESCLNLEKMVKKAVLKKRETGTRLLWGTANLFSHPMYTHGAATNPDPLVFAHAAAQVRRAIDATVALGGGAYVFWGGREGYSSLLNTDMKREREQLAVFLHMAVDYSKQAGFKGKFFIEPKPREPSTHQYDFDAASTIGFLKEFGLDASFMLNIEANHASLAAHSFEHELMTASMAGMLGSVDINRGDSTLGWDTDQFPTELYSAVSAMYIILGQGGLKYGGLNFDAKVRRGSFDEIDLFHGYIGGMDTFAKALLIGHRMQKDGFLKKELSRRYSGYRRSMGKKIMQGNSSLPELEKWAVEKGDPKLCSGRQEALENIVNSYIFDTRIV